MKDDLINVKELGLQAVSDSVVDDQTRCPTVDLKTRMQVERSLHISRLVLGKVMNEVAAVLRMTQIVASGGEVDTVNFIGSNECSNEDGTMRAA